MQTITFKLFFMLKSFTLRHIFLSTLMLGTATLWAQGPNHTGTYYERTNGKAGAALKTAFFTSFPVPFTVLTMVCGRFTVRPIGVLTANFTTSIPTLPIISLAVVRKDINIQVKATATTESTRCLRVGSLKPSR